MTTRRRRSRPVLAALALLATLLAVPSTSTAAPPSYDLDVLGDSYGSGSGVPPYEACGRSQAAYGVQIDGRMRLRLDDFVACAGATTGSLVAGGQLDALDAETDLVTLSIGGNDIGWSSAVVACLAGGDPQCALATEAVRHRITDDLPGLLDGLYADVRTAAPHAEVVVTGYPRLFSPEHGALFLASPDEQQVLNEGADLLNSVLVAATDRAGFTFVDVSERFVGHGANSPDPWILGPLDPAAFHPNAAGYDAYTEAVTAAIRPSRLR